MSDLAAHVRDGGAAPYVSVRQRAADAPVAPSQGEFVLLDSYGRILDVAQTVADRFGFPRQKLLGKRFVHRLCAESRPPFQARLVASRAGSLFPPLTCDAWTKTFERLRMTLTHRETPIDHGRGAIFMAVQWEHARPAREEWGEHEAED